MSADSSPVAVVYDCMVFLQGAARAASPAGACLALAEQSRVRLFLSPPIIAEISDVLTRPTLQRKFAILTLEYVNEFLRALLHHAIVVPNVPSVFHYARDPKDEPYLNLALAVSAQYLVSRDRDLLDLMDTSTAAGADFRQNYPSLTILDPVDFLRLVSSPKAEP